MLSVKGLLVALGVGTIAFAGFAGKKFVSDFFNEGREYRYEVEKRIERKVREGMDRIPVYVECEGFSGRPSEVFRKLAHQYGVPEALALLIVGVESGGEVNLYATSCDVCKSCGGITSERWKENPKVRAWKEWVIENRDVLYPYLSKGGRVINCSVSPECWCNVGFGLLQIASFNLPFYPKEGVFPKPYAPEEESPYSPYNLCVNLSSGFRILSECLRKHEDLGRAICCYNGTKNSEYLELVKELAKKLGVERSWKAKIVDFFDVSVERIKEFFRKVWGEEC